MAQYSSVDFGGNIKFWMIFNEFKHLTEKRGNKMLKNNYKEAKRIELYDAGVVLQPKNYGDGSAGWPYALGQSYYIDGRSIDTLAKWLGRQQKGKTPNIHIFKEPMVIGDGLSDDSEGYIIGKLWAKIDQPQLLQVRIRYSQSESNGDLEDEDFDQDFTYSGAFKVWWAMCDREEIE